MDKQLVNENYEKYITEFDKNFNEEKFAKFREDIKIWFHYSNIVYNEDFFIKVTLQNLRDRLNAVLSELNFYIGMRPNSQASEIEFKTLEKYKYELEMYIIEFSIINKTHILLWQKDEKNIDRLKELIETFIEANIRYTKFNVDFIETVSSKLKEALDDLQHKTKSFHSNIYQ